MRSFRAPSTRSFAARGLQIIRLPYRAPRANAFAERWVGTVRREALDHVLILGRCHMELRIRTWVPPRVGESAPDSLEIKADALPPGSSSRLAVALSANRPGSFLKHALAHQVTQHVVQGIGVGACGGGKVIDVGDSRRRCARRPAESRLREDTTVCRDRSALRVPRLVGLEVVPAFPSLSWMHDTKRAPVHCFVGDYSR